MELPDPVTSQAKHVPPQSHSVLVSKSLPLKHAAASMVVVLLVVEVEVVVLAVVGATVVVIGRDVVGEDVSGVRKAYESTWLPVVTGGPSSVRSRQRVCIEALL